IARVRRVGTAVAASLDPAAPQTPPPSPCGIPLGGASGTTGSDFGRAPRRLLGGRRSQSLRRRSGCCPTQQCVRVFAPQCRKAEERTAVRDVEA
ncbi:MAG: hypothetical protein P1V29_01650, partial [Gammaproteobacteria bacterium]|nr:hypothetical protein [Gammaproteobacteria bacterium]